MGWGGKEAARDASDAAGLGIEAQASLYPTGQAAAPPVNVRWVGCQFGLARISHTVAE
jgi:hypothetical protein